jgi:LPPG:FO 2-phospho-L-lactate transferase
MALNTSKRDNATLRVVALAGGVGGAKLADGLAQLAPNLTIIGNTGDDFRYYGLAVSPDLDTVMYTLARLAHPVNGWGLRDDTRQMIDMLKCYGEESWFGLGDRDIATNLLRTYLLSQGKALSEVTAFLTGKLDVTARLIPMTDDRIATMVGTRELGVLEFQEYFVRHRWQPTVTHLWYDGADSARPAPGVLDALNSADVIVICPSNPVLSVEPILRVPNIRAAILDRVRRSVPCVAVSPVIAGAALKGPTVKIMNELGMDPSVAGIAAYYGDLIDAFVIDHKDQEAAVSQEKVVTDIRMETPEARARLAREVLAWVGRGQELK